MCNLLISVTYVPLALVRATSRRWRLSIEYITLHVLLGRAEGLEGDIEALAESFVGVRGAIDRSVRDAFRHSGLAHMFGRDLIVLRTADAKLVVLRQRGQQYELDRLARHHGFVPETLSCRPSCRLVLQDDVIFAYHDRSVGLSKSCREVDVIVMPFAEARYSCRAELFDSRAFVRRVHRQFASEKGKLHRQHLEKQRLWQRD